MTDIDLAKLREALESRRGALLDAIRADAVVIKGARARIAVARDELADIERMLRPARQRKHKDPTLDEGTTGVIGFEP